MSYKTSYFRCLEVSLNSFRDRSRSVNSLFSIDCQPYAKIWTLRKDWLWSVLNYPTKNCDRCYNVTTPVHSYFLWKTKSVALLESCKSFRYWWFFLTSWISINVTTVVSQWNSSIVSLLNRTTISMSVIFNRAGLIEPIRNLKSTSI